MLLPALIYYAINAGSPTALGWGIPMATDTAFAIGLLVLLRERVPKSAFAFLTALAIIDDIGAILVIAFFYSEEINPTLLVLAAVMLAGLALCNVLGIRRPSAYLIGGTPPSPAFWSQRLSLRAPDRIPAGFLSAQKPCCNASKRLKTVNSKRPRYWKKRSNTRLPRTSLTPLARPRRPCGAGNKR